MMSVHSMLFSPLRCCECVLYQVRPSPSTLPHPSFNTFGQCLAVILGQCLASTLHRFHVIAVLTEPLVLVGWFPPRMIIGKMIAVSMAAMMMVVVVIVLPFVLCCMPPL